MSPQDAQHDALAVPSLELMATLYTLEQLRAHARDLPQIALAGRSNVGKSSLVNALARRRKLARVSSEPGKTRSINLFRVVPDGFVLADLPGYGYARRGREERRNWALLIQKYLESTPMLRALALLIDCRVPMQESDRVMAEFARARSLPVVGVLTKADKCSQRERAAQQAAWVPLLGGQEPLPVSSVTRMGMSELWGRLRAVAGSGMPEDARCGGGDA
ncbi:MAG: YihA family ribosome biogenesis GTP-binding protein [Mailhella sp.]|nr:YihA family ribosome biogenesis GTP-binding protein [Mailhella sp.]